MAMAESRNALPRMKAGKLALAIFQEALRISSHDFFLFIGVKMFASRSGMGGVLRVWDDSDILYDAGRGVIYCPDRENRDVSTSKIVESISVAPSQRSLIGSGSMDALDFDERTVARRYKNLAEEGLQFGTNFQTLTSMKTDKARLKPEALSSNRQGQHEKTNKVRLEAKDFARYDILLMPQKETTDEGS
ncbi:MAG: hypothetical protein Q9228_007002 [Teloschistes exilis]